MSKEETLTYQGIVTDCLPNAFFKVQLDESDHNIIATISGKIRRHNINILQHDKVDVEVTPYDLEKGRIVYRHR
jgi:translation initiation factor IF-1|tara:strand:+ start:863 stop:1084 length:222 start_codon:yes stop_codon:yes gene_type:complete